MTKANKGNRKDIFFSFTIKPENRAIAINGEKPDHSILSAKKYLHTVWMATRIKVNSTRRVFVFISVIYFNRKFKTKWLTIMVIYSLQSTGTEALKIMEDSSASILMECPGKIIAAGAPIVKSTSLVSFEIFASPFVSSRISADVG